MLRRNLAWIVLIAATLARADVLSLKQALELADQNHPQLRAGEAQIDGARAGITSARAYPNPAIDFLGGRQTARKLTAEEGVGASTFYGFSQPLEFGALRPSRIQLAERGVASSEAALSEIRLAVLGSVRRTFFEVLRHRGAIEIA